MGNPISTSTDKISFIGYHKPALHSGKIPLNSTVDFTLKGNGHKESYSDDLHLFVAGPRFIFSPAEIHSVFPPRDALGEFDNVLPHIELNVNNLPWQRFSGHSEDKTPWLGLILLQEDEWTNEDLIKTEKLKWKGYQKLINDDGRSDTQKLVSEITDHASEGEKELPEIKVLKIKKTFAEQIIATPEELQNLTHIRVGHNQQGNEIERSIVVCGRMPRTGARAEVHLISLEKRFDKDGKFIFPKEATDADKIPFVSIHSWQFACPDGEQFKVSDKAISRLSEPLKSKVAGQFPEGEPRDVLYRGKPGFVGQFSDFTDEEKVKLVNTCHIQSETFKGLMDALEFKWLHIPTPDKLTTEENESKKAAKKQFEAGSLPIAHGLRQGGKTVSWYRGPLIADQNIRGNIEEKLLKKLPIRSSDHLLAYDPATKMLDISYASAWELGRLITVSNSVVSQQIAQWKTSHARDLALVEQNLVFSHIPFTDSAFLHEQGGLLEQKLQQYFTDLSLLKTVPFQYLIPHESYLPDESMRFFYVDPLWVECLLDGAFSIGRTTQLDQDQERDNQGALMFPHKSQRPTMTGILLRSDLVSGWSSLMVEAYKGKTTTPKNEQLKEMTKVKNLRFERLGPSLLIVIFEGEIDVLTLHLPPESLHFGFNRPIEGHEGYFKELKKLKDGTEIKVDGTGNVVDEHQSDGKNVYIDLSFNENTKDLRIINTVDFKTKINNEIDVLNGKLPGSEKLLKCTHSGHLAIELIEGVPMLKVNVKN